MSRHLSRNACFALLLLTACTPQGTPNGALSVSAGPDQTVTVPADEVVLTGTATAPEGSSLTASWTQTGGPASITISDPAALLTTAAFPVVGSYTLSLAVTAGAQQASDEVLITVLDNAPQGTGTWESLPSSSVARQEVSYVQVGGKLYLAGGSTLHEAYDPAARTWTTLAPLPADLDHIQGVTFGDKIYYIGGCVGGNLGNAADTVYIYDPESNAFSEGASMPRPRCAGGVGVYEGKIYYAGGLSNGDAQTAFDVYDPATDSWAELPDMPRPKDHAHAAVVGSILYSIGGRDGAINATYDAVDTFDFASGSWATLETTLPTERGGFASAVVGDEILIIGGEGGGNTYAEVEAFDTEAQTWRTLAPMPTPRHGIQAAVCGGGIYLAAGGIKQGVGPSTAHDVLYPGAQTPCTPS